MSSIRVFGLGLLLASSFAAAQTRIPFKAVKSGSTSLATAPAKFVIKSEDAFDAYWNKNLGNAKKPKGINWTTSEVIAIHLGHRGSRSYSAIVNSVAQEGDQILVTYTERLPSAKNLQRQQQASPFVIISIPIMQGDIAFRSHIEDPGNPFSNGEAFPLRKLVSGGHSLIKEEATEVVSDAATMGTLWENAFGRGSKPPVTDFRKWRYVAIFLGQRPTPGYEIVIKRIARIGPKEVEVIYSETKPAKGAIEPQMVMNPFVILELPLTDDVVTITREKRHLRDQFSYYFTVYVGQPEVPALVFVR